MDGRGRITIFISRNHNCLATCVKSNIARDEPLYWMVLHLPYGQSIQNGPKLYCGASAQEFEIYEYVSIPGHVRSRRPVQYMRFREWVAYMNRFLTGPDIVAKHTREWNLKHNPSNRW